VEAKAGEARRFAIAAFLTRVLIKQRSRNSEGRS
jgi:hypothetical protein